MNIFKEECNLQRMKENTYFISDIHLGAPSVAESQNRERKVIRFLTLLSPIVKGSTSLGISLIIGLNTNMLCPEATAGYWEGLLNLWTMDLICTFFQAITIYGLATI